MNTVHLTVNGEPCRADVAGRTQLAELLRDHLHLTGTHLGCEHGVCGACTVLVDGRPIRSCITYAQACEGANVVTVEGLGDDPIGRALRDAFARHHALQCGFCTPGMLITAWDVVNRLAPTDEADIRRELSGNLCRCTGYMGLVAAVRDVARQRRGMAASEGRGALAPTAASDEPSAPTAPSPIAFEPFEIDPIHLHGAEPVSTTGAPEATARPMTQVEGWTLVEREFVIEHPVEALWTLFEDVPRVAPCLPGVHNIESVGPNRFTGRAEIRFGPVAASFHGEGTRETDAGGRTGVIAGHGSDRRGHASLEAELRYAMSGAIPGAMPGEDAPEAGPRTRVDLAIRFRIQGGLAQFNRADLVESFTDVMLAEFAGNCERALAGEEVRATPGASGFALLWRMIRARLGF
ncbi:MAG: 2Fe-2S iron-sulfur cluster-binding protein [Thiotrichales bacterium]|nr:2Fe-2S iron-sulfur cluster-binding protein [Thiotrichales bacterium]